VIQFLPKVFCSLIDKEGKFNLMNAIRMDPLFKLVIILYTISLPVGMIKIFHLNRLSSLYINFLYISMLLLSAIFVYKCLKLKKINLDILSIFLIFIFIYGLIMGMIMQNDLNDVFIDSGRILFVFLAYLYFFNRRFQEHELDDFMRYLSISLLIVYSLVIAFSYVYAIPKGMIGYFSIASQRLILPLIYFYKKNPKLSALSFVLILFSGKRGVVVSVLIMAGILFVIQLNRFRFRKQFINIMIGIVILSILLLTLIKTGIIDVNILLNRWEYLNPWSEKFDLRIASSGRVEELIGVFTSMKEDDISYLLGAGNGYSYRFDYIVGSEVFSYENYRNAHISMINFFMLYGILNAIIFYSLILSNYKKKYLYGLKRKIKVDSLFNISLLVSFGLFVYTFFVYELFQEALIWIFLAAVNKQYVEMKKSERK